MTLSRIHFTGEFYFLASAFFLNLRHINARIVEIMLVYNGMFISIYVYRYIETIVSRERRRNSFYLFFDTFAKYSTTTRE